MLGICWIAATLAPPDWSALEALGERLDVSVARPDLDVLRRLQARTNELDPGPDALRRRAARWRPGDPGRAALVVASAWTAPDAEHLDWLATLALGADERDGRAAIHALGLIGRPAALEALGRALLRDHPARAGAALRQLASFRGPPEELERWVGEHGDDPLVGRAIWALAVRTDPDAFGPRVLARAFDGHRTARAGVAELRASRFVEDLVACVREPSAVDAQWTARAAWRALVAGAHAGATDPILAGLRRHAPGGRSALLEALHTWPVVPGRPPPVELWLLHHRLREDPEAARHLACALEDRLARWGLTRHPPTAREDPALDDVVASMRAVLARLPEGSESHRRVAAWLEQGEGSPR